MRHVGDTSDTILGTSLWLIHNFTQRDNGIGIPRKSTDGPHRPDPLPFPSMSAAHPARLLLVKHGDVPILISTSLARRDPLSRLVPQTLLSRFLRHTPLVLSREAWSEPVDFGKLCAAFGQHMLFV